MRLAKFLTLLVLGATFAAPGLAQSTTRPDAAKPPSATTKPPPQRAQPANPKPDPSRSEPPKPDPALVAAAQRIAGSFLLASADGARSCSVALHAEADRAGGFALALPLDSCAAIPFAALVRGWTPDPSGAIRLLGPEGRTIAEFTEATGGSYEALREGDGVYFLAPPGGLQGIEAPPEELLGEWSLSRARGGPVQCRWILTDTPVGSGRKVEVAPGCTSPLSEFAPTTWRIEGGNVVVASGSGQTTLRFARQEDGTWAKTPERGRPLFLARP
ncbi:MAG: AprI/Inh family metalloprotease inhibitor [Pseudomonadota bacterium]